MGDGFFLLAGPQIEIDASVVMLAEFGMELTEQLSQGLAVPGHQFREEERGDRGVALGKVEAGANAAAFFAADQNVLLEHQLANVFEPNGNFVKFAAEFCGELVDEFGNRKSFGDISW